MGAPHAMRVVLVMSVLVLAELQCVDQNDVIGSHMQQQFGQWLDCGQLVKMDSRNCDHSDISTLCCMQCAQREQERKQVLVELAPLQDRVKSLLRAAPKLTLRSGAQVPSIGLGTGGVMSAGLIEYALRSGYRVLDTAIMYENHGAVGAGIRASGVPREEVFVVSKVPPWMMGYEAAREAVEQMRRELELDFVDMCLLHWPSVETEGPKTDAFQVVERAQAWRSLEKAKSLGNCRHIGVSNFMPQHLQEMEQYARELPEVNQIEYTPYLVDNATLGECRRLNIMVQAYGSIQSRGLLGDAVVQSIAAEVGRSEAQVLLRWGLQEGVQVLPKSSQERRVLENAQLWDFALTGEQQRRLSALDRRQFSHADPHAIPALHRIWKNGRAWPVKRR